MLSVNIAIRCSLIGIGKMDGFDAADLYEAPETEVCKCEWQDDYIRQQIGAAREILRMMMVEYDDDWECGNCKGRV